VLARSTPLMGTTLSGCLGGGCFCTSGSFASTVRSFPPIAQSLQARND
jgi:hypothetical protein